MSLSPSWPWFYDVILSNSLQCFNHKWMRWNCCVYLPGDAWLTIYCILYQLFPASDWALLSKMRASEWGIFGGPAHGPEGVWTHTWVTPCFLEVWINPGSTMESPGSLIMWIITLWHILWQAKLLDDACVSTLDFYEKDYFCQYWHCIQGWQMKCAYNHLSVICKILSVC